MSLAKNAVNIFNRDLFFNFVRLLSGAVVARSIGPKGFGIWATIDLLLNYSRVFGAPRFEISSVHFMPKTKYQKHEITTLTNIIPIILSFFIIFLVSYYVESIILIFFNDITIDKKLILCSFAYLPIMFSIRNYMYYLLAMEDILSYNRMLNIRDALKTIFTLYLLIFLDLGLWSLIISMHIAGLCALIYGMIKVHKRISMKIKFNFILLKKMFNYTYKVYFSEAFGFLSIYLSNLITALLMSPANLAFFTMGKGKAEWLNRITNATATVLLPRVSNQIEKGIDSKEVTAKGFRLSFVVLIFLGIIGCIFIYPATLLLYGEKFIPLVQAFLIVIPGVIIYSSANIYRQYFMGIGRPEIPMKISFIPLILQCILCYILIPEFGFIGAAMAVSITFFITGITTIIVFKYITSISFIELIVPTKNDIYYLLKFANGLLSNLFQKFKKIIFLT